MAHQEPAAKTVRLDKWLKFSRLFKTRALATRACEDGKVKVNETKAKPARMIRIGDVLTIKVKSKYRTFDVLNIVQRSISNKDARELYHERVPEISEASQGLYELLQTWDAEGRRKYKGRPTKKERRDMDKFGKPGGRSQNDV